MILKFKSTAADLKFKTQINKLDIIAGNVLYLTNQTDIILKLLKQMQNSMSLQKQVDEFFTEDTAEHIPDSSHVSH